jgi:hypothetical protein
MCIHNGARLTLQLTASQHTQYTACSTAQPRESTQHKSQHTVSTAHRAQAHNFTDKTVHGAACSCPRVRKALRRKSLQQQAVAACPPLLGSFTNSSASIYAPVRVVRSHSGAVQRARRRDIGVSDIALQSLIPFVPQLCVHRSSPSSSDSPDHLIIWIVWIEARKKSTLPAVWQPPGAEGIIVLGSPSLSYP